MTALGRSPEYHWNQIISKSVHQFSRRSRSKTDHNNFVLRWAKNISPWNLTDFNQGRTKGEGWLQKGLERKSKQIYLV